MDAKVRLQYITPNAALQTAFSAAVHLLVAWSLGAFAHVPSSAEASLSV
jgi:hypothetical protein